MWNHHAGYSRLIDTTEFENFKSPQSSTAGRVDIPMQLILEIQCCVMIITGQKWRFYKGAVLLKPSLKALKNG